ncbi:hypothetical protein B0H13DRAFT_2336085 [Mycena leptocephala]|nr:hypothetical protein B0H13DRAFT_2336085 [Mycena leptocephala]
MSRPQAHSPQALSSIATNSVGASLSGFKHGQNETITFNLKRAEDPEEDFAFVQGAVVRLHCRVQPFKTSPSPPPFDAALKSSVPGLSSYAFKELRSSKQVN